ncbi:MAG: TIGR03086 family metal-binding protein [Janthinobacterium lividum]
MQTGPLDRLSRTSAAVGDLVDGVRADQWSGPTPCDDWTVARLVSHLVGMNRVFASMLLEQPPPAREAVPDDRLAAAYRETAATLVEAFARPGVLGRSFAGPRGTVTGEERLRIRLYDLLAHGWDVARATGQPALLPQDAAEQALSFVRGQLRDEDRPGRFAPAQEIADEAPAVDRLVAFLGRRVQGGPGTPST